MANQDRAGPSIPSIKPAQDQVDSRRSTGRPGVPRQSNFNGMLVFVIALMAAVMAVGGYTLFEMQNELSRSNDLLSQSQSNIRELDARLAATGTDVSRTMDDLESQVNTNFAEIDKLSAVSLQNVPKIETNRQGLEKLQIELDNLQEDLELQQEGLDGRFSKLDTTMKSLSAKVDAALTELREFNQVFALGDGSVTNQVTTIRNQVQEQAVVQEANKRNLAVLTNRLKKIDEAIAAIDQHRLQVNRQLLELKGHQEQQNQDRTITLPSPE